LLITEFKEMKTCLFAEIKDKYLGTVGCDDRDDYKDELGKDVLGK
jgi:hypothetical protein